MAAATAFATINIWTGCPLVALWVAGQVSGEHRITMTAFGVFVLAAAVLEGLTLIALAWLNDVYDELTGRQRVERRSPWLRAMSDEAEHHVSQRVGSACSSGSYDQRVPRRHRVRRVVRVLRWTWAAALHWGSVLRPKPPTLRRAARPCTGHLTDGGGPDGP
jgi:hypothetical protein